MFVPNDQTSRLPTHTPYSILRHHCCALPCIHWASSDWRSFILLDSSDRFSFTSFAAHSHAVRLRPNIVNGLRCLSSTKSRSVAYSHIKRKCACSWRLRSKKKKKEEQNSHSHTNALDPVLCTRVIQVIKNTQKRTYIHISLHPYVRMVMLLLLRCCDASAQNWRMKRKTWRRFYFSSLSYNSKTRCRGHCLNIRINSNFNFLLFMKLYLKRSWFIVCQVKPKMVRTWNLLVLWLREEIKNNMRMIGAINREERRCFDNFLPCYLCESLVNSE